MIMSSDRGLVTALSPPENRVPFISLSGKRLTSFQCSTSSMLGSSGSDNRARAPDTHVMRELDKDPLAPKELGYIFVVVQ